CRVRPAVDGEPVKSGRLVALDVAGPIDPVVAPAFHLLQAKPLRPETAIKKLSKDTQQRLVAQLEQTGRIRRTVQPARLVGRAYSFPLTDRERVGAARA
ncbi:GPP34 family phosphoprotein, partial [Mycobacterium sp. ITM-2017-0098]